MLRLLAYSKTLVEITGRTAIRPCTLAAGRRQLSRSAKTALGTSEDRELRAARLAQLPRGQRSQGRQATPRRAARKQPPAQRTSRRGVRAQPPTQRRARRGAREEPPRARRYRPRKEPGRTSSTSDVRPAARHGRAAPAAASTTRSAPTGNAPAPTSSTRSTSGNASPAASSDGDGAARDDGRRAAPKQAQEGPHARKGAQVGQFAS